MASNLKYPEDKVLYFIRGDQLGVISNESSTNESRTGRKAYKGIDHAVSNGLLVHYYGNPNKVVSINSTLDIDNLFHSAIVHHVKKCLYMDRAGSSSDGNIAQVSMGLMAQHERSYDMLIKKYGTKKRSKTGGTRAIVPPSLT